jgi:hypothetical protein
MVHDVFTVVYGVRDLNPAPELARSQRNPFGSVVLACGCHAVRYGGVRNEKGGGG